MGGKLLRGRMMGMDTPLNLGIITTERRDTQEYAMFSPKNIPLTNQIHMENE